MHLQGPPRLRAREREGTSVEQIDKTYGHLLPDSEEYLRGLPDTYDTRGSGRAGGYEWMSARDIASGSARQATAFPEGSPKPRTEISAGRWPTVTKRWLRWSRPGRKDTDSSRETGRQSAWERAEEELEREVARADGPFSTEPVKARAAMRLTNEVRAALESNRLGH